MGAFARIKAVALLLLVLPAPISANDYRAGLEALSKQEFAVARASFLKSAERGHAASQNVLGRMALAATDRPANPAEALGWLLAAQENGATDIERHLAVARAGSSSAADTVAQQIVDRYGRDATRKNWLPDYKDPSNNPCSKTGEGVDPHNTQSHHGSWESAAIVIIERNRLGHLVDFHSVFRIPYETKRITEEIFHEGIAKRERTHPTSPSACGGKETLVVRGGAGRRAKRPAVLDAKVTEKSDPEDLFISGMARSLDDQPNTFDLIKMSAQGGHGEAQYYLAMQLRNLTFARKWLELAAEHPVPAAKIDLAEAILMEADRASQLERVDALLSQAMVSTDEYVLARIAAIRAAALDERLRNPQIALDAAKRLDLKKWPMPVRIEAAALAFAASGNFDEAIRLEKQAIRESKRMGHDVSRMNERLSTFESQKMWFGYLAAEYR
jgi:TPR repeat protein